MPNNDAKFRFTLSYVMVWFALFGVATVCFTTTLIGGNGWLHGYSGIAVFSVGLLLSILLVGDPLRRAVRILVWPMILLLIVVLSGAISLIWYINSSIPIFEKQHLAEPGEIEFKKIGFESGMMVLKYRVDYPPNCELTSYFSLHERDGQINEIQ